MNKTPNTGVVGLNCSNSKITFLSEWRSVFAVILLLLGGLAAHATTFTFNNTGCQTVKVYKVFLLFENYQTSVNASQSYSTTSASWGEQWVYRSSNGTYLGGYTIPWVSNCTHDFNSGGGPSAPVVGNISHPTCNAMGSVTLNGLPSGSWTLTRNPGGVTTNGSGSSTTITGLDAGAYSFSVNQAGCTASAYVNATLNAAPVASSAPALYSFTASNACPATTVNLNSLTPLFVPSGYTLSWHTGTPANASNKVSNPSAVAAGTYYATFYNTAANCYSGAKTTKVTAVVGNCGGLVRSKYRTFDGSMNNISNSSTVDYGKVGNAFSRELPAGYADGISAMAGPNRPNPRAISNKLSAEREDIHNDRDMAGLFYSWGQFIDHDMTDTKTNSADPANISLPSSESYFTNPIAFNRSMAHPGTGVTTPREQTNLNSAWLDASMVYGLTTAHSQWLRAGVFGKMKTSDGNLLPFNTLTGEYDSPIDPTAPRMDDDQGGTKKTFVAGDHRVAEHPGLTSLHTVFMREHNRICDRLVAQGLIDDEEIYQKARKEVGALIQHITYTQWISSLGVSLKTYSGYNPNVKVDMLNAFSAAAYRWHTMVENDIIFRDNECQGVGPVELALKDVFFNINIVRNYDIGGLLKGLSVHRSYETDLKVNNGLRNFLGGNFGTDLVSINIQRGRDHGLPSYNEVRKFYTGSAA
ncbi:MAG: peroxidase family protein, partial [Saprospiraceae bacterium]|nr:peroxidase family protein [Saprospiraceae bacterium]